MASGASSGAILDSGSKMTSRRPPGAHLELFWVRKVTYRWHLEAQLEVLWLASRLLDDIRRLIWSGSGWQDGF